jgi:hypothetical protein
MNIYGLKFPQRITHEAAKSHSQHEGKRFLVIFDNRIFQAITILKYHLTAPWLHG